jgi:uncharacterized phage protein gp47/JayE
MALPIDQLTKPVTKAQAKQTIYDMLAKAGIPVTSWQSGAVLRTIVWILATLVAGFSQLLAVVVQGLFLDTAVGVWLTLLAKYVYGVTRRTATFATGELSFDNAAGGEYPFAAEECFAVNDEGARFVNVEAFTITALASGLTVVFRAVEAGAASTSESNSITALETPLLGVDVTNPGAFVGTDEQSDEELRQDCRDALGALSPFGAKGAYAYFAKHVPGGDPITREDGSALDVNRVQVVTDASTGEVTVYVATPSGEVTGDVGTPGDDLYLIHENIQAYAVPQCITETTESAEAVLVNVFYTAFADAAYGFTTAEIKDAIDERVEAYGATYPIAGQRLTEGGQGYLFANRIRAIILETQIAGKTPLISATLTFPLADTELDDGQIANIVAAVGSTVTLVSQ